MRSARLGALVPASSTGVVLEKQLLRAYAAVFSGAALYHLLCLVLPAQTASWSVGSSPARHALFVLVNCGLAFGVVKRPRGFLWLFTALCLQQLLSHGTDLARSLRQPGHFDTMSALVLVALPVAWVLLWRARHERS